MSPIPYEMLEKKLLQLHKDKLTEPTGQTDIGSRMAAIFGEPDYCLRCGGFVKEPSGTPLKNDIDAWFCRDCCPVCTQFEPRCPRCKIILDKEDFKW